MAAVRDVEIDPEGTFKYILVRLQRPGGEERRDIVRGTKAAEFHSGWRVGPGAGEATVSGPTPPHPRQRPWGVGRGRQFPGESEAEGGVPGVSGHSSETPSHHLPPPPPIGASYEYEKWVNTSVRCHFQTW